MTNHSPFITVEKWQRQVGVTPEACKKLLALFPSRDYLDGLYGALGASVDLWIGHSAIAEIGATDWVWPDFASFVRRNGIGEWLFSPNISSQLPGQISQALSRQKAGHKPTRFSQFVNPLFSVA